MRALFNLQSNLIDIPNSRQLSQYSLSEVMDWNIWLSLPHSNAQGACDFTLSFILKGLCHHLSVTIAHQCPVNLIPDDS